MDSFFDLMEIRKGSGGSVEVEDYDCVVELSNEELQGAVLVIEVTNLGEARWLSSRGEKGKVGCVYLVVKGLMEEVLPIPFDVGKGETVSFSIPLPERYGKISFYLESYGRAKFGEKRSVLINKK